MKFTPPKLRFSDKHFLIDKANSVILISASVTTAVLMISLVVSQSLIKQLSYQNKVVSLRVKANEQLKTNISNVDKVMQSYNSFDTAESVLGDKEQNSVLVLDALPSKYDFPALVTSLEKLMTISGVSINGIKGTDTEASAEQESIKPQPIEIPFSIDGSASSAGIENLIKNMERSIRPLQILSIQINASTGTTSTSVQSSVSAKTYYQPKIKFGIDQTTVPNGNNKTVNKKAIK